MHDAQVACFRDRVFPKSFPLELREVNDTKDVINRRFRWASYKWEQSVYSLIGNDFIEMILLY